MVEDKDKDKVDKKSVVDVSDNHVLGPEDREV
jgi:hypothetical protein